MPIGPLNRYRLDNSLIEDKSQKIALDALDKLFQDLINDRIHSNLIGIYMWGKVGRGKTFLMDLFHTSVQQYIPEKKCLRQHFHHFMFNIHQQLKRLSGTPDPLKLLALDISHRYKIICFDEFFVTDIGDAMLLGRLFQYLFSLDIILIATSNIAPTDLYKDGLQRVRFIPAIEAIEAHCKTIHLDGKDDHRLRKLNKQQIYFQFEADQGKNNLARQKVNFQLLERFGLENQSRQNETILDREIPLVAKKHETACFEFSALCEGPRSHFDYIELAKRFQTIIILNIPSLRGTCYEHIQARGTEDSALGSGNIGDRAVVYANMDDACRRFIALIDELYDQGVNLYLSSSLPIEELYNEGCLLFEFQRAQSRLVEMASIDYLQNLTRSKK